MVTKRKPKPVKPVSMQTRQDRIFYAQDAIARLERSLRQNPYGLVGNKYARRNQALAQDSCRIRCVMSARKKLNPTSAIKPLNREI